MHFCGNPFHDLPQLLLALPFIGACVRYARARVAHRHHGDCDH